MLIIRQYHKRTSGGSTEREFYFQKFFPHNSRSFTRIDNDGSSTAGAWKRDDILREVMNGHSVLPFVLEIEYTTP